MDNTQQSGSTDLSSDSMIAVATVDNTNVGPLDSLSFPVPPEPKGLDNQTKYFYVVQGSVIPFVSAEDMIHHSLQLDSDIYRYDENGNRSDKAIALNRKRYITNESFKNVDEINDYLRKWGKIPEFLELRDVPNKGFGVFAKVDIPALTFLGFYDGVVRPMNKKIVNSVYYNTVTGFDGKPCFVVDGENITFSNWSRFINDGKSPNLEYVAFNMNIYHFTLRDIKADEELIVSYGPDYWNAMGQKGIKKLD
jgi:hypothetical protein